MLNIGVICNVLHINVNNIVIQNIFFLNCIFFAYNITGSDNLMKNKGGRQNKKNRS